MTTTGEPGVFQVTAYRCRCGHEWVTKDLRQIERPKMCPRCKTVNWDKVRSDKVRSKVRSTGRARRERDTHEGTK